MLQKLKITSYTFLLCLFGLTFFTVSPVLAEDSAAFVECQKIKPNGMNYDLMKEKKNCFKDLAGSRDSAAFVECQKIKPNGQSYDLMKEKKNCFRDLARDNSNFLPIEFTTGLPIFRNYEICMIRILYAIGGNDSKPHTEFMNSAQFSNYHNECFSEVLNGKGDSEGYGPITDALVRKQLDDLLTCDYVWNKNIAQFYWTLDGNLQYRICRHMNWNDKGIAVSFAD